jgi:DNA polymerase alpha subunit A
MAAYRPAVSAVKEEDFLASILGNINNATATAPRGDLLPRKRKPEPYARSSSPDATSFGESSFTHGFSSDGMDFSDIDDAPAKSTKRQRTSPDAAAPTAERLGKLQVVSEPEEDEFDRFFDDHPMDFDAPAAEFPKTGIKAEIEEPALNGILRLETEKETLVAEPAWMSIHASLKIAKDDEGTLEAVALNKAGQHAKVLEDDGSVNLFWFDYFELEGNVHLVGKVRDKESGSWVSCCVTVGGIQRNIFVLPREQRLGTFTYLRVCC